MRYQLSRKPLVPSNRTFHHGRSTIVGRLVVLSVFMLVLGVPSTPAQTGQDERCSAFTRQAKGLCTAAVSEGCFDGVQSQECDELTTTWNKRYRDREGPAPWAGCPCAEAVGSAVELNERFASMPIDGTLDTDCFDVGTLTRVRRADVDGGLNAPFLRAEVGPGTDCEYSLRDDRDVVGVCSGYV
jgi:hypothetical protein